MSITTAALKSQPRVVRVTDYDPNMKGRAMRPAPMARSRVELAGIEPKLFHARRDDWMALVQTTKLPQAAYRVAWFISTQINREHGYAWPTNKQIAEALAKSIKTINEAVGHLDQTGLIDRETRVKRDEKKEAIGKERRIYPCTPKVNAPPLDVNAPLGGEYTKDRGECTDGVSINLTDSHRTKNLVKGNAREGLGADVPSPFTGDYAFVDAFDRTLVVMTGGKVTDSIEHVVGEAFDATTSRDPDFMPFDWRSVCLLNDSGKARDWFVARGRRMVTAKAA